MDAAADSAGLIVMYHYVRPDRGPVPGGIRPLFADEFERQLDWLCQTYDVVGAEDFLPRLKTNGDIENAKPICLLTFDDGTKDHAQVVTPILSRRGLTGVFFVLSWPAERRKMPLTHAVHWLLGQGDQNVWNSFRRYARDRLGGESALGDATQAARIYHYETPTRARIKYAANMALPIEATERIVEAAALGAGRTMEDLAAEWFVSADDIREMDAAGMTIAPHGSSHRSLQTLGPAGMAAEIKHSSAYIASLTGRRAKWFAPPFGASGASPGAVAAMRSTMRQAGIAASVTTEKRLLSPTMDAYALPRLDTIDLPPRGSAPARRHRGDP